MQRKTKVRQLSDLRPWDRQKALLAEAQMCGDSPEAVKSWIRDPNRWPNAESYDPDSLEPCETLGIRERSLRKRLPDWFWAGEEGAAILSVGTGKGYFERKFWGRFDRIYIIDPSVNTSLSLKYYPIANAEFLAQSLYDAPFYFERAPKYCWLGASIHYLFGEFNGWHFMQKLAMMVSDSIIVDAGVFDGESPQGQYLRDACWNSTEQFEVHRNEDFSFAAFQASIKDFWSIEAEWLTDWINDRRSLILKRKLPARVRREQLGKMELVARREEKWRDNWTVFKGEAGYYKETALMSPLLTYDTFSKILGWRDFVTGMVYEGSCYCGFVVRDLGDVIPDDPAICESLMMKAFIHALPLGLIPADFAKSNIRIYHDTPVWIDIFFIHVHEIDAFLSLWNMTSLYKGYSLIPSYAHPASRFLESVRIPEEISTHVALQVLERPETIVRGTEFKVRIGIANETEMRLSSAPPFPVHISYHWQNVETGERVVHDGKRSVIDPPVERGRSQTCTARVIAPEVEGILKLQMRLVQEGVRWFESNIPPDCLIRIL